MKKTKFQNHDCKPSLAAFANFDLSNTKENQMIKQNQDMNKLIIFCALFILCLSFVSCKKYLDIQRNSEVNPIATLEDCQFMLNNTSLFNKNYPSDGILSSDDFFVKQDAYQEVDVKQEDRDLYVWKVSAIRDLAQPQWQASYQIVYNTNLILEALEKISKEGNSDVATINKIRGEALFFRAFAFWQVAQLYTKPYSSTTAGTDPGIPLRLKSDINEKSDRGTVQQTYNKIIQDLQEAVSLLPSSSNFPTLPNKAAAHAMLARIYLGMEDYSQALISANAALALNNQLMDYNGKSTTSWTPFDPRFNEEVIFHSTTTDATYFLAPWIGYGNRGLVNPELIGLYEINDLRKDVFFEENISDVDYSTPNGDFRFTGNYEPSVSSDFFNGLAVDELYLIRAESYARTGNLPLAMKDVNDLLRTRWVSGTYIDKTASTETGALNIILTERRKELVMRGLRWTDLRRLNKDARFAKTLTRTILGVTYTLPPNDLRYTLLIPSEEVNVGQIVQNTR